MPGKARSPGSEGAPARKRAGATRQIESAYLALRHTMLDGHVLRSGDRAGLEQEVWALLTVYQLLRMAMTTAVETRPGTNPDRASFTTALHAARDQLTAAAGVYPDPAEPRRARRPSRSHRPDRADHAAARPSGPLQRPQGQVRDLALPQPRRRPPRGADHLVRIDILVHTPPLDLTPRLRRGPSTPRTPRRPTRRDRITEIMNGDPERAWSGQELAEKLEVKPRNMLTQLAEWTRLGWLTRTGAGTYTLDPSRASVT